MVKIGLALYSVRGAMNEDPLGTLRYVSNLGYHYIEAANHRLQKDSFLSFDITTDEFNAFAKENDISLISAHIGKTDMHVGNSVVNITQYPKFYDYTDDDIKHAAEEHLKVGNRRLINAVYFFPNNYDEIMKICDKFQHWSNIAKSCGSKLLYHAHFQEFIRIKDKFVLDYLMENTDMNLELDTFWAMRGGEDPIEMIKHFAKRIELVHQKDFSAFTPIPVNIWDILGRNSKQGVDDPRFEINAAKFMLAATPEVFTEIGLGIMPIQKIIDAVIEYTDAEYIILEQDYPSYGRTPLESVKLSMETFKKFKGIQWQ